MQTSKNADLWTTILVLTLQEPSEINLLGEWEVKLLKRNYFQKMGHSIKPSKSLRPKSLSYSRAKPIHDMTFFILSLSWLAERYVGGFKDKLSLRKHPFLFALRRWGRLAQRNVCDSATEIPYWWRKIWPESGQKRWLVDGLVTLF